MTDPDLIASALQLRTDGLTYKQIGEVLGVDTRKAWKLCNMERGKALQRETHKRYVDRGNIAIADMTEAEKTVYFARITS